MCSCAYNKLQTRTNFVPKFIGFCLVFITSPVRPSFIVFIMEILTKSQMLVSLCVFAVKHTGILPWKEKNIRILNRQTTVSYAFRAEHSFNTSLIVTGKVNKQTKSTVISNRTTWKMDRSHKQLFRWNSQFSGFKWKPWKSKPWRSCDYD